MENNFDILIIGAGPSGCVAAAYLSNKKFKIKVVEKAIFPRFVIGESLLPRCMDHFDEVGLLDSLISQNFEIKRGVRFIKNKKSSDFLFNDKHTEGWEWTWQAPRADFDNVLANEIISKGVDVAFNNEVIGVDFDNSGNSITTIIDENDKTYKIKAKYIIDSSGYGRVLPKLLNLIKPPENTNYYTIFSHVKLKSEKNFFRNTTIHLIDDNIWGWEIPFSNGVTSMGFVGRSDYFEDYGDSLKDKFFKLLEKTFQYDVYSNIDLVFDPIELKNYSKAVKNLYGNGYVLTGNSAEFLDPIFSSGVALATESGLLAAKLIEKELLGKPVNWKSDYSDYLSKGADVFRTYVKEWYSGKLKTIFFSDRTNPIFKKQITSVLAGYVWDDSNPFVSKHKKIINTLSHIINMD